MSSQQWSVLIIGDIRVLSAGIESILNRSAITVERVAQASASLERVTRASYNLVILQLPLPDLDLGTFIKALRAPESASRAAGLLVTGKTSEHDFVSFFLGRGINRFVPTDAGGGEWLDALATLLAVPPRSSLRALVQLETIIRGSRSRSLAQTENLSETGMLIRGDSRHFQPGSTIDFELILPGEEMPIRGTAEIVRQTERSRENIDGFGARFVRLEGDGRRILESFLSRKNAS
ncbi:MAG: PilZ domain-containing protein [Acidobacteria bacterium]|nr:PilZ domain-containing protein [Acidobacteriota bacterium]